jgi:hypothetical protein
MNPKILALVLLAFPVAIYDFEMSQTIESFFPTLSLLGSVQLPSNGISM